MRNWRTVLLGIALLGGVRAARGDTVVFKAGTRLECKVVSDTPEGLLVVLGNEGKGSMVLDRGTIERVEYDYDSRLGEIRKRERDGGAPLYREHYDLGVWCEERAGGDEAMYDRALDRYLHVLDKPGVPPEAYLRLGRMYERCSEPNLREAYAAYSKYLELKPDSAEAVAAMQRLGPAIRDEQPGPAQPAPGGEGLEVKPWKSEKGWCNPCAVRSVSDTGNERTAVLELKFEGGAKDKAAFTHPVGADLSGKKAVLFDVYNPGDKPVRVAVALVTGGDYAWFETRQVAAAPKKWTLGSDGMRFDLTMKTWKSKASGWAHRVQPENLDSTRNLVILVYNGRQDGVAYVDNIRIEE